MQEFVGSACLGAIFAAGAVVLYLVVKALNTLMGDD